MSAVPVPRSSPPAPSPDDHWAEAGRVFADRLTATLWAMGDWALQKPPRTTDSVAADLAHISIGQLRSCRWMSRKFGPERRRDDVSHSHHMEVGGLPDDVADRLLGQAAKGRWTVAHLRAEARAAAVKTKVDALADAAARAASADWTVDAERIERECERAGIEVAAGLRSMHLAVVGLAKHPGRGAVHGNRVRGVVERLRSTFEFLEHEMREFLAADQLAGLQGST